MGKIFRNKELGKASRWLVAVFSVDWVEQALCTFPICAFHFLSKGCSSQEGAIFLWRAVEKDIGSVDGVLRKFRRSKPR